MHIRPKSPGVINGPCLNRYPHAAEGLLANIFNGVVIDPTGAKRDLQPFAEVRDKVVFGRGIMSPQATEIVIIERIEVHWSSVRPVYFTPRVPLTFPVLLDAAGGAKKHRRWVPFQPFTARLYWCVLQSSVLQTISLGPGLKTYLAGGTAHLIRNTNPAVIYPSPGPKLRWPL